MAPVLPPPIARSLGSADSLMRCPSGVGRRSTSGSTSSKRKRASRSFSESNSKLRSKRGLSGGLAEATVPAEFDAVRGQLSDVACGLTGVLADLQEISRGIHPAILSEGGLGPALKTLARRSSLPVALDVAIDRRLPESVEVGAYYAVAEALTNAAKHAQASQVQVRAETDDANLSVLIRDDGTGGADPGKGSGLIGLIDRVEALGGQMRVTSPQGIGTTLRIAIPVKAQGAS